MKNFKELLEAAKDKSVVLYFGEANPPTLQHLVAFSAVKKIAESIDADHAIVLSKTQNKNNPLSLSQKLEYVNAFYPGFNVVGGSDSMKTAQDVIEQYSKKYKRIVLACSTDSINENIQSVETISYGLHDPDASATSKKMIRAVNEGDYVSFRKGLLVHSRDIDARRMFNDIRLAYSLDTIKESIPFVTIDVRERYIAGEIFLENTYVESDSQVYKIINRNSNYVTVSNESGILSKKWLTNIQPVEASEETQLKFKGIMEMKFTSSDKIKVGKIIGGMLGADVSKGSNAEQMVNAGLRATRGKPLNAEAIAILKNMLKTADDAGIAYDPKLVPKLVVSEPVAEDKEEVSADFKTKLNPVTGKPYRFRAFRKLDQETIAGRTNEDVATDADTIKAQTEKSHLKGKRYTAEFEADQYIADAHHAHLNTLGGPTVALPIGHAMGGGNDQMIRRKVVYATEAYGDSPYADDDTEGDVMSDEEIDDLIKDVNDWDDIIDTYDSSELAFIDADTGEHVGEVHDIYSGPEGAPEDDTSFGEPVVAEPAYTGCELPTRKVAESEELNEVLSRLERIKARLRFHRTAPKRQRAIKIALKRHSSTQKIGHRARAMAIKLMKVKIARKPLNMLSIPEKERVERIIQKRATIINRIALRLIPRVRKIEQTRLSHPSYTK